MSTNITFMDAGSRGLDLARELVLEREGVEDEEEYAEATDGGDPNEDAENLIYEVGEEIEAVLCKLRHLAAIDLDGTRRFGADGVRIGYPREVLDAIGDITMALKVAVEDGRLVVTDVHGVKTELLGLTRAASNIFSRSGDTDALYDRASEYRSTGDDGVLKGLFVPLWPMLASEVDSPFTALDGR